MMQRRIAPARRRLSWILALVALVSAVSGCPKKKDKEGSDVGTPAPFAVKDQTEGLLLTWIDDKGDFHVEQKVADVPPVARDAVRVVDPAHDEGTHGDRVFVADLRVARPDGSYATHSMTRGEFDALALSRRKEHTATLADDAGMRAGVPSANANANGTGNELGGGSEGRDPNGVARPAVIIYGAEWCGPCHQAAAYLRNRGIPFVEKDIEADGAAAKEMREKLAKNGLHGGSIPVLDVRGKLLVGFSPSAVDEALGRAM
jgi:glutaredoxin